MKHASLRRALAACLLLASLAPLCMPVFAAQEAYTDRILASMRQPMVLGSSTFEYDGVSFQRVLLPRYILEQYEASGFEILPGQSDARVKAVKQALYSEKTYPKNEFVAYTQVREGQPVETYFDDHLAALLETIYMFCGLPEKTACIDELTLFLLDELVRRRGGGEVHSDFLLLSAITLHNIPEGMAVGLAFALAADGESLAGAFALALGIGVQNFPEGAAVALPVYQAGKSKRRAFWTGVLSGAVEPLFGVLVVLAAAGIHALMPWLLSFAAGAMLYVVAEELLPRAGGRRGTCGFLVGFLLMMILDVALG